MEKIKKASDFFSSRRSISVKNLKYPGPSENQIMEILKNAFRVPDHGKLEYGSSPGRQMLQLVNAFRTLNRDAVARRGPMDTEIYGTAWHEK